MNKERDDAIAQGYLAGKSVTELSQQYPLKRERIRQILRKAGVWKRPKVETERPAFVAVNVTEATKKALRAKADERGQSMSKLMSEAIEEIVK